MRGSLWKSKFPEKFQHASEARKKKSIWMREVGQKNI